MNEMVFQSQQLNILKLSKLRLFLILIPILVLLPVSASFATGSIAGRVAASCGATPTVPNVSSCSACHTSGNPSVNDLNAAGMESRNGNFAFFCPTATTPPPTTNPPPTTPPTTPTPPTSGMGMGTSGGGSSMGMGSGGSFDDDDDEMDDDDDDGAASSSRSLRSLLRSLRSRRSRED